MDITYSEQEARAMFIPLAVSLVNNEAQRLMGRCNTKEIEGITRELVNILLYGTVTSPEATVDTAPAIVIGEQITDKRKAKAKPLKYA